MKEHFGLLCPVIPVKGYTFDIPTDTPNHRVHLSFKNYGFVATNYEAGKWRIAGFGDIAG